MSDKKDNLVLWESVEKTNPKYTKKANVGGNKITAIAPQFQIKNATEKFGSYGKAWGFKDINFDFSLIQYDLVVFKAVFFYPDGEFPIVNSAKLFMDNAKKKIDDNFAKKLETDTLTKALSKLGFNADIFLGLFDDVRYLEEITKEFAKDNLSTLEKGTPEWDNIVNLINSSALIQVQQLEKMHNVSDALKKELISMMKKVIEDKKPTLTKVVFDKAVVSKVKTSIQKLLNTYKMTAEQRKSLKEQLNKL